ncbi:DegT/DnrJ/EryC1/StrS family aminotransferase [Sulfurimonas sp.]
MIRYVDIKKQNSLIKSELIDAFDNCLENSDFVLGSEVQKLEKNICEFLDVKYAVGVNSGTDALVLSMKALGIKKGDEVITVSHSFVATALSIVICGAKPIFVDVDEMQQMDISKIEEKITKRTKAILPVHLMGIPANISAIKKIAKKYNLKVIEDAAQAIGSKHDDKYIGSFGDVGCFSFHPLKNLGGCGDGGLIVTNKKSIYKKLLLLRNLGLKDRENCVEVSGNSRLDNIQASALNVKFSYLDMITDKKIRYAKRYFELLDGIGDIKLPLSLVKSISVYHTFVIRVNADIRDNFIDYLYINNVETKIHYKKAIHQQKAFKKYSKNLDLRKTEKVVNEIVSLPIDYTLEIEDIEYVCNVIKQFFTKVEV